MATPLAAEALVDLGVKLSRDAEISQDLFLATQGYPWPAMP